MKVVKTFLRVDAEAGLTLVCTRRCHTLTEPEGAVGVRMWAFCFIHTSFELCDYAYDVVCDRLPPDSRQGLDTYSSSAELLNISALKLAFPPDFVWEKW